jgi:hypothetical protein|tara:strand:- start:3061 stop:4095 length:1035 start_codon:yes stop_codon:yes gene_type:complete
MSSGIIQLVSIGAQDEYIMGTPEISFFNSTFKRHSNFSQSVEKQTIHGAVKSNSLSTVRFERSGDLLGYTFIAIDDMTKSIDIDDWTEIIESVELLIGGHVVDTQDSFFSENIAIDTLAQNVSRSSNGAHPGTSARSFFYPLRFFFCENPQSALPLVSLQNHDVEIRIRWKNTNPSYNFEIYSNYYYLDNEERAAFTSKPRDILIYQVQKNIPSMETTQELNFNHPVKYLASSNTSSSSALTSVSNRIKISINGVDLSPYKWCKTHFVDVPHYYHTNFVTSPDIFLFPFCITTSLLQPSGSLNFSRIENSKIQSETLPFTDDIYAVNYNILRVENGMAGLRYAN